VIELHPQFVHQFTEMAQDDENLEILGEISALIDALDRHGPDIEGEQPGDASHPIVISRFRMYALRRTPPTQYTPYADSSPILRVPYVWFTTPQGQLPVVMLLGDKGVSGNLWYPTVVQRIETVMIPAWERTHPKHSAIVKRSR
jgi:hypothetical protein